MNIASHAVIRDAQDASYPARSRSPQGPAYTYELAGNGVFLEAYKPTLGARIPLAVLEVRDLLRVEPFLDLAHGRVPTQFLETAVGVFASTPDRERYVAIVWEEVGGVGMGDYGIRVPCQDGTPGHVHYEALPGTVVNLHSHPPGLPAAFSGTDDRDDQGFQVSVVVAELDHLIPVARARVCMYGYFWEVPLRLVFEGPLGVRGPEENDGWQDN